MKHAYLVIDYDTNWGPEYEIYEKLKDLHKDFINYFWLEDESGDTWWLYHLDDFEDPDNIEVEGLSTSDCAYMIHKLKVH